MSVTHADTHDSDKLVRWHRDLTAADEAPSVHALFLVSADDTAAHDVFRSFRSSCQSHQAPFHRLMIFGQHGLSTTAQALLTRLGLDQSYVPLLVLFDGPSATVVRTFALPAGISSDDSNAWKLVLTTIEGAGSGGEVLEAGSLPGHTERQTDGTPFIELLTQVLEPSTQ